MTKGGKRMITVSLVVLVILAPCLFGLLFALNASTSSEGNSGEETEEHSELIKMVMDASAEDEIPASKEANSEDDQDQEQSVIEEALEGMPLPALCKLPISLDGQTRYLTPNLFA